ncbi:MAG: Calx-beta domain-containing protein [Pyrinomonadaceae bacterium]
MSRAGGEYVRGATDRRSSDAAHSFEQILFASLYYGTLSSDPAALNKVAVIRKEIQMSKRSSSIPRSFKFRLVPAACVAAGLICLATWLSHAPRHDAVLHAPEVADAGRGVSGDAQQSSPPKLEGVEARAFVERTSDGQALLKAVTAARFGLQRQERSPFDAGSGAGYLGMSHEQNLNAWFGEEGVTVRPTVSEKERAGAWRLGFRLKAYGYGAELRAVPPVTARNVRDNRIEYVRSSKFVEWYENRAEGIEQGFTLSERPEQSGGDGEPLRVSLGVEGDLRARVETGGQEIVLADARGRGALNYNKLVAVDAGGKQLSARMEATADGREIALVVDDREAVYPIVIDPIVATLETNPPLDAGSSLRQTNSFFGSAVAIYNNYVVVGSPNYDLVFPTVKVDAGAVFIFSRSGSSWSQIISTSAPASVASSFCGSSVSISGNQFVYGCPGANNNTGKAFVYSFDLSGNPTGHHELIPTTEYRRAGDTFGTSVGISSNNVVVGAPMSNGLFDLAEDHDKGMVYNFKLDSDGNVTSGQFFGIGTNPSDGLGASVAIDGNTVVVGAPGGNSRYVNTYTLNSSGDSVISATLQPGSGSVGDRFGAFVDVSGNTVVVSASADDDKGTNAGAAYVFVRDANGQWSEQQKLTAGDARAGDRFGFAASAVYGNTIVVGAFSQDGFSSSPDPDRGEAYIFTRSGSVWTQQASISGTAAGDGFGCAVDVSGNTVLVGANGVDISGQANAGAAYAYRLDCTPPHGSSTTLPFPLPSINFASLCPGGSITIVGSTRNDANTSLSYQWRRNGVNIPGAIGDSYTISNATASDAGSYDVIFSNSCGSDTSTPFTVTVYTFSINPTAQNFSASGSSGIVNVSTTGSCPWTAASNASWITVTSGASGSGSGTVGFNVAANTGSGQRTGSITIAGQTFTVTQDGTTAPANTFQFSQSSYSTSEGSGSATVTVTRSGSLSAPATVEYATTDGTATDRGDYNTTIGRLRFAAGESAKTFSVLVTDDAYAEGTESLNLALSNPTGGPALGPPSVASLSITDNDAVTSGSNPIDATPFFVRQQYVDFFSREPDAGGLAFWSNGIESCGSDAACREVKRIDTSAAFFLSIEFQETGFLVHRLYRASFGRLSRYREFVRDTQEIGRGVVVNSPGWEAQLEANKAAFLSEFAARPDFQTRYGGMTNAQYVDALNANTGGSLSQAERDSLVAGLTGGTETRATALRKAADDPDFRARETSPAFVLMQYYGYLRRNPDDAPDSDFAGYNFWLGKLSEFGGDYRRAEMVRAFLVSTEYRRRFGL